MNREELEQELYDASFKQAQNIALQITTQLIGEHNVNPGVVAMACQMVYESIIETSTQEMIKEYGSMEDAVKAIDKEMEERAAEMGEKAENVVNMSLHKIKKNLH